MSSRIAHLLNFPNHRRHVGFASPLGRVVFQTGLSRVIAMSIGMCSFFLPSIVSAQPGLQIVQQGEEATVGSSNSPEDLRLLQEQLKTQEEEEAKFLELANERAKEIKALRNLLIETANSIQENEREVARIEREIERLTLEEQEAVEKLAAEDGNLSEILAALQAFELSRPPALLVSPEDANRAARAAMLLSDAAPALSEKAKKLRELVETLAASRRGLADQRAAFERTSSSLIARRQVLSELMARKESERDVAAKLAAAAQKKTAALAAQATSLKGVVSRLQQIAHSITPRLKTDRNIVLASGPASSSEDKNNRKEVIDGDDSRAGIEIIEGSGAEIISKNLGAGDQRQQPATSSITTDGIADAFKPARSFVSARGALRAPVVGSIIGQFGQSIDGERLDGVRIETRGQAIVTAPYESRVVFAQYWGTVGNMIVLDVGAGYFILLMGIGDFLVEAGQIVNAGEPLAEMGVSDLVLDMQIRKNGEPINPSAWLANNKT